MISLVIPYYHRLKRNVLLIPYEPFLFSDMHVADDTLVVSQHVRSDSLDYFTEHVKCRFKCRTQNYKASVIFVALEVSVLLTRSLTLTAAAWNHEFKKPTE